MRTWSGSPGADCSVIGPTSIQIRHRVAQSGQGARSPGLDRPPPNPDRFSGLGFGQVEEKARPDHLTVLVAKVPQRGEEQFTGLGRKDRRLG